MVRTTWMLSAKNAYGLVHARLCNGAEASLPWKLLRTYFDSCASIMQAVVCRPLLPPLLLSWPNPSPDAVCSRNPSKSMLAHDEVAVAVLHKHHSIIRVGAGLFHFVFWSHSHLATGVPSSRILFWSFFRASFFSSVRQFGFSASIWIRTPKSRERAVEFFAWQGVVILLTTHTHKHSNMQITRGVRVPLIVAQERHHWNTCTK